MGKRGRKERETEKKRKETTTLHTNRLINKNMGDIDAEVFDRGNKKCELSPRKERKHLKPPKRKPPGKEKKKHHHPQKTTQPAKRPILFDAQVLFLITKQYTNPEASETPGNDTAIQIVANGDP